MAEHLACVSCSFCAFGVENKLRWLCLGPANPLIAILGCCCRHIVCSSVAVVAVQLNNHCPTVLHVLNVGAINCHLSCCRCHSLGFAMAIVAVVVCAKICSQLSAVAGKKKI